MRWEISEFRRLHYSPRRAAWQMRADRLLEEATARIARHITTGSPSWHRALHVLGLLPSLSGSLALRRGFMAGSGLDRGANGTFFPGLFVTYPANVEIGDRVFVNRNVFINALAPIKIGDRVLIGPNVVINSGNHTFTRLDVPIQEQPHELEPIEIGDDVWIGANVVVTAGVTIGSHAVIGAGAVVTHDIPPFAIAVGVPAAVIRYRTDDGS